MKYNLREPAGLDLQYKLTNLQTAAKYFHKNKSPSQREGLFIKNSVGVFNP
jgi:hypothetical protein